MDWLDNYLDGLGQYKVTVSPADTHVWGVKPKLNNVQQKMLFDAAAQSELEYRLLVQEARQAEIDAGMGGSYDAGSAAREGQVTPSATVPDAPVLTSIGSGNAELSAFFTAPANNGGSIITNYKYSSNAGSSFTTRSPASTASPIKITDLTNGTEYDVRIRAVNIIGDGSISNALSGTPSAPAGIPVASTASVVISGNATFNGTAVKKVNLEQCFGDPVFGGKLYVGSGVVYAYGLEENYGKILIPPQATAIDDIPEGAPQLDTPANTWKLVYATYLSEESSYPILATANNSSTDANYIPTTGWSPSITITAA